MKIQIMKSEIRSCLLKKFFEIEDVDMLPNSNWSAGIWAIARLAANVPPEGDIGIQLFLFPA